MKINFPKPLGGEFHLISIYFLRPLFKRGLVIELLLFNFCIQFEFKTKKP